jgi:RNA recognition motif-containing protein
MSHVLPPADYLSSSSVSPYSQSPPLATLPADASSNFNLTGPDLYEVFGKYGPIRQIRLGNNSDLKTKGTAYIVFESPDDAREAQTHLNGFHLMERYIVGE